MFTRVSVEALGLLSDIISQPSDDTPRLVYADWCKENGDPDRGEFITVQIDLARLGPCPATIYHPEFYRAEDDGKVYVTPPPEDPKDPCGWCPVCVLRARERILFSGSGPRWWNDLPGSYRATVPQDTSIETAEGWWYRVRRGFIDQATLPLRAWMIHGPELVRSNPLTRVDLNDRRPYNSRHRRIPVADPWVWIGTEDYQSWHTKKGRLPLEITSLMPECPHPTWVRGCYSVRFHSREAAVDALSEAAIRWAWMQKTKKDPEEVPNEH